ncbi:MAG: hypothetical protein IJ523_04910 [Succinivibrionaceae bacterium]|nr:hypothetical protein [Succinivibrionaceae bacterium]
MNFFNLAIYTAFLAGAVFAGYRIAAAVAARADAGAATQSSGGSAHPVSACSDAPYRYGFLKAAFALHFLAALLAFSLMGMADVPVKAIFSCDLGDGLGRLLFFAADLAAGCLLMGRAFLYRDSGRWLALAVPFCTFALIGRLSLGDADNEIGYSPLPAPHIGVMLWYFIVCFVIWRQLPLLGQLIFWLRKGIRKGWN